MSESFYLCSVREPSNMSSIENYDFIFNVKFLSPSEIKINNIIYSSSDFNVKNMMEIKNVLLNTAPFLRSKSILQVETPIEFNNNIFIQLENNHILRYKSNRFTSYKYIPFDINFIKCFINLNFLNINLETDKMITNNNYKIINSVLFLENLLDELDEVPEREYFSKKILSFLDYIDS
jgi:hypothetical protein